MRCARDFRRDTMLIKHSCLRFLFQCMSCKSWWIKIKYFSFQNNLIYFQIKAENWYFPFEISLKTKPFILLPPQALHEHYSYWPHAINHAWINQVQPSKHFWRHCTPVKMATSITKVIWYSAIQSMAGHSCFPILYWIRLMRRISRIQLEPVKHDWRLLKVFSTHSWLFRVIVFFLFWFWLGEFI